MHSYCFAHLTFCLVASLVDVVVVVAGWLTTVLMDYKSQTSNCLEKCSKTFSLSLFIVYLSLLPLYVKREQNERPSI